MKFTNIAITLSSVLIFSCSGDGDHNETHSKMNGSDTLGHMDAEMDDMDDMGTKDKMAMATISSASDSKVSGKVTFKQTGENTVRIMVDIKNLPEGTHAMHLHEKGDCSASDASSAGGHWNPTNVPHGKRGSGKFHKGDITNLEVGNDMMSTMEMDVEGWSIGGADSTNILDKAVIIHAGADDFTSQPSGDAGKRIACGKITMMDEGMESERMDDEY